MHPLDPSAARRLLEVEGARIILTLLDEGNGAARIVGGAVRNSLIGRPLSDIDIATTLPPEQVMDRAARAGVKAVPTGIEHGTVTLVVDRRGYEVTTLRRDVETDGRRAVVAFTDDFYEDALRRDFTINQLSLSADGEIHDYAGGLDDLAARKVRFIGDAETRIREDYLRILRFFRFSAEYAEGALDPIGLEACARLRDGMARLSRERVWAETKKLLCAPRAHEALSSMVDRGVWAACCKLPADLAALAAAKAILPEADAVTRLAALCLRTKGDPEALDEDFRLSSTERKRLEQAAAARERLMAAPRLDAQAYRSAAFRTDAAGARDGLMSLSARLNRSEALALMALPAPRSPWRGADLVALGVPAGPLVGQALAQAEAAWEAAGFPEDPATRRSLLEASAKAARP